MAPVHGITNILAAANASRPQPLSPPGATLPDMDKPSPDPAKLLAFWMEWERGETTPGMVMKNLKNGGLREILEQMTGTSAPS